MPWETDAGTVPPANVFTRAARGGEPQASSSGRPVLQQQYMHADKHLPDEARRCCAGRVPVAEREKRRPRACGHSLYNSQGALLYQAPFTVGK